MTAVRRIAAIDIGTVTTRLLVADVDGRTIAEVDRSTDITHLGEGLTASGRLGEDAMSRVAEVIGGYGATMKELGVEAYSAIATSASRDAANAEEFVAMLAVRGVVPQVVSGTREAELTFRGATFGTHGRDLLVVDCGGGSTEYAIGDASADGSVRLRTARSIDVGSRRLTEMFLRSDPPSPAELSEAREWTAAQVHPYFDALDRRPSEMIAVAGTATTLAAIALGLEPYDPGRVHGHVLSGVETSSLLEMLAAMPLAERLGVVGLHPQRASVIVAGTLIIEVSLALAGLDALRVSEHDILYGILLDTYCDLQ